MGELSFVSPDGGGVGYKQQWWSKGKNMLKNKLQVGERV